MVALVATALEDSKEHKSCRNGRVKDAKKEESGDHEREGDFRKDFIAQRSESRCRIVLGSGIGVDYDGYISNFATNPGVRCSSTDRPN